ncbi:MAG: recombination regulator RecX [Oscillospiraceae bacterium]|nr:recombination regulator RecX [Oscillospiraceae bacterium]
MSYYNRKNYSKDQDDNVQDSKKEAKPEASAHNRALALLNRRAYSEGELYDKLVSLGEPEESAAECVAWAKSLGFADDLEYARGIARSYTRRGYGAGRVRNELYRRKVPRELWDEAMPAEETDSGAPEGAVELLRKRLRGETPDYAEKQKAVAALARRGFSWSEISAAFGAYLEELSVDNDS